MDILKYIGIVVIGIILIWVVLRWIFSAHVLSMMKKRGLSSESDREGISERVNEQVGTMQLTGSIVFIIIMIFNYFKPMNGIEWKAAIAVAIIVVPLYIGSYERVRVKLDDEE